jgi:amino acid adenylation domain-containing protein
MTFLLPHAVDKAAHQYPDREAVRFCGRSLTYAQLAGRAGRLARLLREQGVKRGDRVGIYVNKSLESAISLYGIMKSGAAYVPLDPFAPVTRLNYVIRDCGIRHLITQQDQLEQLQELVTMGANLDCLVGITPQPELPIRCVTWDEVNSLPTATGFEAGTIEDDLAYILYTSGSTGDPKGIMHTHRSGLGFAEWAASTYGLTFEDRLSNHAPLHFDLSTFDFFAGALAGASTVIIPEGLTKVPASLSKFVESETISVWYSVPFALIQLLLRGGLGARDLSALRWVLFAGEVFPTKHLRTLMAQLPNVRFSNLFGPTETNVCTYYHVAQLPADLDEPIPIGRVCENAEALVVDTNDEPVPAGEVGELLVRGSILMRGYWGQPERTERAFWRRSSLSHLKDTFYRTGDLVQLQSGGNYKYLGRKDRQIKTRGYRIELDEVEVGLLSHELVEEAAVYPIPDSDGSHLIEAEIIPKPGVAILPADLEKHLSSRLPLYAIPARFIITMDLPRTSTGKINRRALQNQAAEV